MILFCEWKFDHNSLKLTDHESWFKRVVQTVAVLWWTGEEKGHCLRVSSWKKYQLPTHRNQRPFNTTSEFTGEYVEDSVSVNTSIKESTLGYLNRNNYWKLNRQLGTSQVYSYTFLGYP
ncbi:MAG: hypothetical protein IPP71_08910 [Bacteroidetes bacterium]|nr:hypothetical protein [Bacteroidota bacterium]